MLRFVCLSALLMLHPVLAGAHKRVDVPCSLGGDEACTLEPIVLEVCHESSEACEPVAQGFLVVERVKHKSFFLLTVGGESLHWSEELHSDGSHSGSNEAVSLFRLAFPNGVDASEVAFRASCRDAVNVTRSTGTHGIIEDRCGKVRMRVRAIVVT